MFRASPVRPILADKLEIETMPDNIRSPWQAAEDEPTIYAADGDQVCQVFPTHDTIEQDNGLADRMALIAAAPALLAALRAIADCKESDLARYCAKVDAIAIDALTSYDCAQAVQS
jgi:hypothetical protein